MVFLLDKPLRKQHVEYFKEAGYTVPGHYAQSGVFYARKESLVATATFGVTKINVKCGANRRNEQIAEFEWILEQALNS